jgi:diguanylate cyclase (GGDEF)-like protein
MSIAGRLMAMVLLLALAGVTGLTLLFAATSAIEHEVAAGNRAVLEFRDAAGDLEAALADQESGIRGYLLAGDVEYLAPFTDGRRRAVDALLRVDALVGSIPAVEPAVAAIHESISAWEIRYADPARSSIPRGETTYRQAGSLEVGRRMFEVIRERIRTLDTIVTAELARASGQRAALDATRQAVYLGTGAAIIVSTVLAAVLLRRWIARPIRRLTAIADRVEAGEDIRFPTSGSDELGRLARSLERMREGLRDATEEAAHQRSEEAARMDEQRTVNEFTELLSYLFDEREVVESAVMALERAMKPDALIVHLLNASGDRAFLGMAFGATTAQDLPRHLLDRCPGVRRGSPYLLEDVARPLAVPCPAHGCSTGTVACLPLTSGTEQIGAIHAVWDELHVPHPSAWAVADRICMQAALTIANRRLMSSLEVSANTDPRTRLPNTRAFDAQAERLLLGRGDQPAALLMLDLDHFKDLNDRHGHPAGDEALRMFAEMLRRSLRPGDVPARYGGEEFAVMLPGADLAAAEAVAERIRSSLEVTPMVLAPGVVARMTVSIGIALAPTDGEDRVTLLASADRALYAAKTAGRNRVVAATTVAA